MYEMPFGLELFAQVHLSAMEFYFSYKASDKQYSGDI